MDMHKYVYLMPTSKPVSMTSQSLMIDTLVEKLAPKHYNKGIDTNIEVIVVSLTTTWTETEVSISSLSWWD